MSFHADPNDCIIVKDNEIIDGKLYHVEKCRCGCIFKYELSKGYKQYEDKKLDAVADKSYTCPKCGNVITYSTESARVSRTNSLCIII